MKLLNKMKELSTKYKTMLSYCLKCKKKYRKHKSNSLKKLVIIKQSYYQSVLPAAVKNQDLLRNKKQLV